MVGYLFKRKYLNVAKSKEVSNHPPTPFCSEEQAEGRGKFSTCMEKMFGQELLFDPVVKHVIDKGIKVSRLTDLEKRAQEVDTAGYLANDNMIVENLGDHADAEVAKGAKQVTENCIKKRLKETKYRTVEET